MTHKEAIEWLNGISYSFGTLEEAEKDQEFRKVTIEALGKQVPKKPKLKRTKKRLASGRAYIAEVCPACASMDIYKDGGEQCPFCSSCGQAIYWSEGYDE